MSSAALPSSAAYGSDRAALHAQPLNRSPKANGCRAGTARPEAPRDIHQLVSRRNPLLRRRCGPSFFPAREVGAAGGFVDVSVDVRADVRARVDHETMSDRFDDLHHHVGSEIVIGDADCRGTREGSRPPDGSRRGRGFSSRRRSCGGVGASSRRTRWSAAMLVARSPSAWRRGVCSPSARAAGR